MYFLEIIELGRELSRMAQQRKDGSLVLFLKLQSLVQHSLGDDPLLHQKAAQAHGAALVTQKHSPKCGRINAAQRLQHLSQ